MVEMNLDESLIPLTVNGRIILLPWSVLEEGFYNIIVYPDGSLSHPGYESAVSALLSALEKEKLIKFCLVSGNNVKDQQTK